jgi:D-glycero-D-manno-heptose 1,7-bisphosphate phosphatase
MQPAIFLDRDGLINANRADYVKSWEEFEWLPRSLEALVLLAQWGRPIVVVTNQSAIGRGLVPEQVVIDIHRRMVDEITARGGRIDGVFYCPHRPDEACPCRKPRPGMLFTAAARLNLDLSRSYMVGDALTDVMAGQAAGCQSILVQTGRGPQQLAQIPQHRIHGFVVVGDLLDAVRWMMQFDPLRAVLPEADPSHSPGVPTHV